MYEKRSSFQISGIKKHYLEDFISENMFYYAKRIKMNNKIIEMKNLSKLVKFIVYIFIPVNILYTLRKNIWLNERK